MGEEMHPRRLLSAKPRGVKTAHLSLYSELQAHLHVQRIFEEAIREASARVRRQSKQCPRATLPPLSVLGANSNALTGPATA
jgi:hypothetical protein